LTGTIFVLFEENTASQKARDTLDGMTFSGNRVKGHFYDEQKFIDVLAISMALDNPNVAEAAKAAQPVTVPAATASSMETETSEKLAESTESKETGASTEGSAAVAPSTAAPTENAESAAENTLNAEEEDLD